MADPKPRTSAEELLRRYAAGERGNRPRESPRRVVADFRGADTDPAKFQSALIKLIGALKK